MHVKHYQKHEETEHWSVNTTSFACVCRPRCEKYI